MKPVLRNRTGARRDPALAAAMADIGDLPDQDAATTGPTADDMRIEMIRMGDVLGSAGDERTGAPMGPLLDRLGARLAYERTGVRLYDALIRKAEALDAETELPGCLDELRRIRSEESEHAGMLRGAILALGGDPTLETPCADLEGVIGQGLVQAMHDPRTTLAQSLHVAVVAEAADVEAWNALAELSRGILPDAAVEAMEEALADERDHLLRMRTRLLEAAQAELAARPLP